MQLLVTHLTRMSLGFFCAAGLDINTGKHVRPALGERLSTSLLQANGGVFALGAVVDLGPVTYAGTAPEVEDYRFQIQNLKLVGQFDDGKFARALSSAVSPDLKSIFGATLQPDGASMSLPTNSGLASLGSLECNVTELTVDYFDKIRLRFTDGAVSVNAPVTDMRLVEADLKTPRYEIIDQLAKNLATSSAWINVGLSRRFKKPGEAEWKHWLQVNNIHIKTDPLGEWAKGD